MSLLDIDLQDGRQWVRVGDYYDVTKKRRALRLTDCNAVPFAPMEAIPFGGAFEANFEIKHGAGIKSGTYFERGDILVGKITPSFENGKQALANNIDAPFGYATTEIIPLHPTVEGQDPRLLFYYLLHPDIRGYIAGKMEGSTGRKRVPEEVLLNLQIPKFDEDKQTAIADALELIRSAITIEERGHAVTADLKISTMRQLFARGLKSEAQKETEFGPVPGGWGIDELRNQAFVQTGVAKGRKLKAEAMVTLPYLRVANVQDGRLDLSEMKTIEIRAREVDRYRLRDGDVVLTEGGDFDKLGRGFIWRGQIENCIHQNHVFAVRTNRSVLSPDFLAYLAQSPYGKAYFLKVAHKTTNLASINKTKLEAFPVLLPALSEQDDIVEILSAIDAKINLHKRKKAVLEDLFQSLLHKLMTGEVRVSELNLSALEGAAEGAA